jgi:hypothetical protein
MKRFKRIIRLAGLILMVLLASIRIAFGLVVPIPKNRRKEDTTEIHVEEQESDKEKTESIEFKDNHSLYLMQILIGFLFLKSKAWYLDQLFKHV